MKRIVGTLLLFGLWWIGPAPQKTLIIKKAQPTLASSKVTPSRAPASFQSPVLKADYLLTPTKLKLDQTTNEVAQATSAFEAELTHKLSSLQQPETQVFVKTIKNFREAKQKRKLVRVRFTFPSGETSGFMAKTDSQGKILRTWGHTRHENLPNQKIKLTALPYSDQ